MAHGANIPLVGLSFILVVFKNSNNFCSSNSSGSIPQSCSIFSGPSGCSGGSILVADTTVPGSKCLWIASSKPGHAYISAW